MDLLKTMTSFVRVIETGSFTGAAEQLGVSRAIVSKHIQYLEKHLSARLLNRSTRHLNLTEIGRSYHSFCVRILGQIEEEHAGVLGLQSEPRGLLKVMAPKSFGNLFVGAAIADFVAAYPELKVSLLLQDGSPSSRDLIDKGVDIAIRISPVADSSAIARQIGALRWILCASPHYLKSHSRLHTPDDLIRHNCLVHLKSAPDSLWTFKGPHRDFNVQVSGALSANSSLALRAAALKGIGIALLPLYSISTDLASGDLVEVLPEYQGPERPITALYPHRPLLLAKVRLLVDFLAERFKLAPVSFADYQRRNDTHVRAPRTHRASGPKGTRRLTSAALLPADR